MDAIELILDTNVLVAAGFRPRSTSAQLVEAMRSGRCTMRWHPSTRDEARAVLSRIPPLRWRDFETLYSPEGLYDGELDPSAFVDVPDPADRKFAALAAATSCILVTSDSDLLEGRNDSVIQVRTPAEMRVFLARPRGPES